MIRWEGTKLTAALLLGTCVAGSEALAFENTKVLPKGVRNVNIRTVNTEFDTKTNNGGETQPLAEPLQQAIDFKKISKDETDLKQKQLEAFLTNNGFSMDDEVGEFRADLKGEVQAIAPIMAYGLTDRITLAVAVPYYQAATSVEVGFVANDKAQAFLNTLADPINNQVEAARDAGDKLNTAVSRLNEKLTDNGYRQLEDWQGSGIGDTTVAAKALWTKTRWLNIASTTGFVAPTGKTDDPDVLNDIPFGDGTWDAFVQATLDQPLFGGLFLNEYVKYTRQFPGERDVRLVTEDESIEVEKQRVRYKLGDIVESGVSMQYEPSFGLIAGLGYNYFKKFADEYNVQQETRAELQDKTVQESRWGLGMIGYSTVPAFQRGEVAVPMALTFTYKRLYRSMNTPVGDQALMEASLYF